MKYAASDCMYRRQRGAALLEYAIAIALLGIVFILIGQLLYEGGLQRAGQSNDAVSVAVPEVGPAPTPGGMLACGEGLSGDECL